MFRISGAQIALFVAACADIDGVRIMGRVRAMENGLFLCYVNHGDFSLQPAVAAGSPPLRVKVSCEPPPVSAVAWVVTSFPGAVQFPGGSFAFSPSGVALHTCDSGPEMAVVTLDVTDASACEWQRRNPYLTDRRPELYGRLAVP
jgi:predicted amidohydrolase